MNKRIYISGAITNDKNYRAKFVKAHVELSEKGYSVINPAYIADKLPEGLSYQEYMHIDLALLDLCDSIYLLEGWEASIGASCEYSYAQAMGKVIIFESEEKQ